MFCFVLWSELLATRTADGPTPLGTMVSVQQLEQIVDFVAENAGRVGGTEGTFHRTSIQHLVQDDSHQLPVVDDVCRQRRASVQRTVVVVVVFINTTCGLLRYWLLTSSSWRCSSSML
uniref:(northern house mosquito) hypothetical protein n=1 Tax=Culex pipiens TaxID=7175 RepID=A0A8D8A761_CULPI